VIKIAAKENIGSIMSALKTIATNPEAQDCLIIHSYLLYVIKEIYIDSKLPQRMCLGGFSNCGKLLNEFPNYWGMFAEFLKCKSAV
jgi:hypothetical protein